MKARLVSVGDAVEEEFEGSVGLGAVLGAEANEIDFAHLGRDHGCFAGDVSLADEPAALEDVTTSVVDYYGVVLVVVAGGDLEDGVALEVEREALFGHSVAERVGGVNMDLEG